MIPVKFAPLIAGRVPVKFAAGKFVRDAPEPLNVVAVNVPFDELNVRLVPVFGAMFPVAAVANKTLQDVSDDSSAAVTDIAVVAVPIILALNLDTPSKTCIPPEVTLTPLLAVINPTESILVTSS